MRKHRSVRRGRRYSASSRAALCLAALVVGAAATYGAGRWYWQPEPRYSAAARVVETAPPEASTLPAGGDVASEDALHRAVAALEADGIALGGVVNELPSGVAVESSSAAAGKIETIVRLTSRDDQVAIALVNQLAEQYADQRRQSAVSQAESALVQARSELATAEEEWKGLQEERRRQSVELEAASRAAVPAPIIAAPVETTAPENPQWTALTQQLESLGQRQRSLLISRTAAHPEVLYLAEEVAEVERQRAAVPRYLDAAPQAEIEQPIESAASVTALGEPLAAALAAADTALVKAERSIEQRRSAVRAAEARLAAGPGVEVIPARNCEAEPVAGPPTGLAAYAIAVGLAVAFAVGWASHHPAADPPFTTVAEAQAALAIPIVGVIPRETAASV